MNSPDKIDILLAKHLSGEKITRKEREEIEKWISEHREEYDNLEKLTGKSANECRKETGFPMFDPGQAWNRIEKRLRPQRKGIYLTFTVSAAACILLLFTMGLFLKSGTETEQHEYFASATDGNTEETLPDGSRIVLARNSEIYYITDKKDGSRKARLKGKAFFEVAASEGRTFSVSTGDMKVTVLGTSFIIDASTESEKSVLVKSGKVKVEAKDGTLILQRNEKAEISDKGISKTLIDDPETVFIMDTADRILPFNDTTIAEMAEILKKEAGLTIEFDAKIGNRRISTKADPDKPEEIVREIAYICGADYKKLAERHYRLSY